MAQSLRFNRSTALASFFTLLGIYQTLILTVVPVEALRLMGSASSVSVIYFAMGTCGFIGRLGIPTLVRVLGRTGVLFLGAICATISAAGFISGTASGLIGGLLVNVFALACLETVLNLNVLDHIPRRELARFEAKRIFFAAAPWTFGPWLGVWLALHVERWVPFVATAITALVILVVVGLYNRMAAPTMVAPSHRPSPNPARYLVRFFSQPRLRLAWFLAVGRASWWVLFQVYAPIYAVQSGLGPEIGGVIVSIGIGWMWAVPLWGWMGRRYGFRRFLMFGYFSTGVLTVAAAMAMGLPWLGGVMLVVAALGAETIDGVGNALYLRAVHPHERSEMTVVFASFRDVAQLGPPALFSVILTVFNLPAIFVVVGVMMMGMSALTRYIPKRF